MPGLGQFPGQTMPTHLISICVSKDRAAIMPRDGWPSVNWDCEPLRFCGLDEAVLAEAVDAAFRDAPRLRTYVGSEDLRNYRSPLERHLSRAEHRAFLRRAKLFHVAKLDRQSWQIQFLRWKAGSSFEPQGESEIVVGEPSAIVRVIVSRL